MHKDRRTSLLLDSTRGLSRPRWLATAGRYSSPELFWASPMPLRAFVEDADDSFLDFRLLRPPQSAVPRPTLLALSASFLVSPSTWPDKHPEPLSECLAEPTLRRLALP